MRLRTLLLRSLVFYWRTHLGVVLGAALGTMTLTGALLVGDSVKATLRKQALERVGKAQCAMLSSDRFFSAAPQEAGAGDDLASALQGAPALLINGSLARADGKARINQAQVLGVDGRFWSLAPNAVSPGLDGKLALNSRAAAQLGVKAGDTLILRVEKPSAFSRDAPLSGEENEVASIRAEVGKIVDDGAYGRFALQASQVPPFTVFLDLAELQKRLELAGRANLLLASTGTAAELSASAAAKWQLGDAGLQLQPLKSGGIELRTSRVFLDPVIARAAPGDADHGRVEALTYFVNELRSGDHAAPYSMATAAEPAPSGFLPPDLGNGEIVINQWLAEDLAIEAGAKLTLEVLRHG